MAGGGDGVTSARRRRERQLRSFLRHERMSVRMAQAEALHHSGDVRSVQNEALRGQKTASAAGQRPGVLKEPEPQLVDPVRSHRTEDDGDLRVV